MKLPFVWLVFALLMNTVPLCMASETAKAKDILLNADVFSSARIGDGSAPSETAWALSVLVASPDGKRTLRELCDSESPEVFCYGLVGLFVLDRATYLDLKSHLELSTVVVVQVGDVTQTVAVGMLLSDIEKTGADPYLFKASQIPSLLDTVRPRRVAVFKQSETSGKVSPKSDAK